MDGLGDCGHVDSGHDFLVGNCGLCGVKDFGVVCGFDVKYFSDAIGLEGIKSVKVVVCEGS